MADPEGYAEAARLWREQASKPDASFKAIANFKTIANAVFFFKTADRATANALLDPVWRAHPDSPDLAPARAILDVIAILGITSISGRDVVTSNFALRSSPEAVKAREEIDASSNPVLLGSAGQQLLRLAGSIRPGPFSPFGPARDYIAEQEETATLAEGWLIRARELAPSNPAWTDGLVQIYQNRAGRTQDPREKVRILREAEKLANDNQRGNVLPTLAMAEFEASDDAAAARDAQRLLDLAASSAGRGFQHTRMVHFGNTVLGRVALARNDRKEAKERLLASARLPADAGSFEPNMTLAQDLLEAGERDAVLEYLELCRNCWRFDQGQLDRKIKQVKSPGTPDLTARTFPQGYTLTGRPAPALKLKDLAGKEWSLDQFKDKPVALEFFNTSCKACRDELSEIEKLGSGVVTLAVNVGENEAAVRAFAEKNQLKLPVLLGGNEAAVRRYEVDVYPTLAMIDGKGVVSLYRVGRGFDVKRDLERGIAGPPERIKLPAPVLLGSTSGKLAWEAVEGAESYVVEWDRKEANGWVFDRTGSLRVIPTRETWVTLEEHGPTPIRWRVYAVSLREGAGASSVWREVQ